MLALRAEVRDRAGLDARWLRLGDASTAVKPPSSPKAAFGVDIMSSLDARRGMVEMGLSPQAPPTPPRLPPSPFSKSHSARVHVGVESPPPDSGQWRDLRWTAHGDSGTPRQNLPPAPPSIGLGESVTELTDTIRAIKRAANSPTSRSDGSR